MVSKIEQLVNLVSPFVEFRTEAQIKNVTNVLRLLCPKDATDNDCESSSGCIACWNTEAKE